ncbi:predicted protein [Histoplasma capsulatum G186AR]|uniref:Uncharacterized protein n=1 Tax=Ajellomyces capsulatus (strain G186AR / H82 / ATCC MYA-2454 / RMSCC 2432) TaxID=447093 RepID=C0NU13_AJECG|nr:uncharacterized protein HCBG_06643 [Histoplasma capsulatum G186AR]EEH05524.1 predicted protein [Histoplasma capsulatum G186AR]
MAKLVRDEILEVLKIASNYMMSVSLRESNLTEVFALGNISKSHASPEVYLPMQAWALAWKLLDQDAASRNETSTVQKQQTRQKPIALINCHSIRLWLYFHTASSLKNVPPEKAGRA